MPKATFQGPCMGMTVAICDQNKGFAYQGKIPWPHIKKDYEFFMNIVTTTDDPAKKNGVLLGRLTYETCTEQERSQPKLSTVITSTTMKDVPPSCRAVVSTFDEAVEDMVSGIEKGELENIWVLGGGENYERAINDPRFTLLYVTRIFNEFPVDRIFPEFSHCFRLSRLVLLYPISIGLRSCMLII